MNPITFRDIAKKAGVSIATVSFALGSNPRKVSAATRERILQMAQKLGYRPNPGLRAWQMQIRSRREVAIQESLGWINDHPERDWWEKNRFDQELREGAIQRARELGYRMDDIWLPGSATFTPGDYVRNCIAILRARGISGVLLPHLDYPVYAEVSWPHCAVVVIGKPDRMGQYLHRARRHPDILKPALHHEVNTDYFYNATLAYRCLAKAGYQRIGLVTSVNHDMSSDQLVSSAVENEMRQLPPSRRVPTLRHPHQYQLEELGPWIRKHRPDAILAVQSQVKPELERLGIRVPDDIGLAHMNVKWDAPHWSGIKRCSGIIGTTAVDLLTACLQRNETGLPRYAKEVLIKGVWVSDRTTRHPPPAPEQAVEILRPDPVRRPPPTCRDIAQRAGVSIATVSFALNHRAGKMSAATADRICRLADEMGYRQNTLLSDWQSAVRSRCLGSQTRPVLAWITDREDQNPWLNTGYDAEFRNSAFRRAKELGYQMEDLWLPDPATAPPEDFVRRCLPILRDMNCTGIILPCLYRPARAEVDWPGCSVVVVGKPDRMSRYRHCLLHLPEARQPRIHHEINPDFFHNATLAHRSLVAAGYRRIGLTLSQYHDMESDQLISSAIENEQRQLPRPRRVPVLRYPDDSFTLQLGPWIRKHRPDAVIAVQSEAKREIERLGLRIPKDIGLAHMDVKCDVSDWSGIDRNSTIISASAVDLLTSSLQRNETGIPTYPKEVLIKGTWVQGKTTREAAGGGDP